MYLSFLSTADNRDLAAAQSRGRRELHLRDQLHSDGDPDAGGHLAPQLGPRARQVPADEHADGWEPGDRRAGVPGRAGVRPGRLLLRGHQLQGILLRRFAGLRPAGPGNGQWPFTTHNRKRQLHLLSRSC